MSKRAARRARRERTVDVSLVVVAHNALAYIVRLLWSLRRTRGVEYELVVVDNRSRQYTRAVLALCSLAGLIDRLLLLERNTFFAPANNMGVAATSRNSKHVVLLNSDIEVRDPDWLSQLRRLHRRGATSFGVARNTPVRADGYCLMIDRDLMVRLGLDEEFEWFWSITKLQAELLGEGHSVRAVREHDHLLYHFGGKSGRPATTRTAKGMDIDRDEVHDWFGERAVEVIERA